MSRKVYTTGLDFEVNPAIINEGMTSSEMQCWDNCAEKWYLGYNLMLSLRNKHSWALTYGGWMHEAWEEFYSTKGKRWHIDPRITDKHYLSAAQLADFDYWKGLAEIQMSVYASRFKSDFKFFDIISTEQIVELEWEGLKIRGKVDMYVYSHVNKGFYVWDNKTAGKIDKQAVTGWDFRMQFMLYAWFMWKLEPKRPVKGIIINALKKPQIKQGEMPTQAFLQRVQSDMQARDDMYFYRDRLPLKKGDLQNFEDTVLRPKIQRAKLMLDPKISPEIKQALIRNKNTDFCNHYNQPCEFINCCKHGLELERHAFRRREIKHTELIETE